MKLAKYKKNILTKPNKRNIVNYFIYQLENCLEKTQSYLETLWLTGKRMNLKVRRLTWGAGDNYHLFNDSNVPNLASVQFSSVAQSCPTLCDPMNRSTPGLPVHHQLPEFTQTRVHWVGDAIQPSHPPPAPSPSQQQGLFQRVSSSHEVVKVLEFQFQHQSFQWIFRTDFL